MDRILVFSDLHGDVKAVENILSRVEQEQADHLLFAGDLGIERLGIKALELRRLPMPSTLVRGNCDSIWSFSENSFPLPTQYATLPFWGRTIFLTHGHLILNWQTAPLPLKSNDIFVTGHTHRSLLIHPENQPIQLNPGSVSSPRDRNPPTYALITKQEISIRILADGRILKKMVLHP